MARFLAWCVLAALTLAACGVDPRPLPAGDPATLTGLRELREHACACRDPACAYRVVAELVRYSDQDPDLRDTRAGVALVDELSSCLATAARTEPGVDAGPAAPPLTGLPACDEYVAMMELYARCDKIPPAAQDATRQAVDQMRSAWADMGNMPVDARRAAEDGCRQATDAMRQASDAMGCQLPPRPGP